MGIQSEANVQNVNGLVLLGKSELETYLNFPKIVHPFLT